MSRDMLDPDLSDERSDRDPYEPGCFGYEAELLNRIVDFYFEDYIPPAERHIPYRWFNRRAERFSSLLSDVDWSTFNHNCFLEGLALKVSMNWTADRLALSGDMFDPLIQALFNNGCNGFVLDYSLFPTPIIGSGCYLTGEPDRPLEIEYRTDVRENFAKEVSHCHITLKGKCSYAGEASSFSTITVDCVPYEAASGAAFCEFHMPSSECIAERPVYARVRERPDDGIMTLPRECTFYVREEPSWRKKDNLKNMSFFLRMNQIYIPDGDEWMEVLRDEWDGA